MKLSKVSLAILMATGSLALGSASAQTNSVTNAAPPVAPRPAMRGADGQVAFLSRQLDLTDEQKPKVKAVLEEQMKTIQGTPREQQREKFAALQEETSLKLKAILTPEQYAKYEAMPKRGPGPRPTIRTNAVVVPSGQSNAGEKKAEPAKP